VSAPHLPLTSRAAGLLQAGRPHRPLQPLRPGSISTWGGSTALAPAWAHQRTAYSICNAQINVAVAARTCAHLVQPLRQVPAALKGNLDEEEEVVAPLVPDGRRGGQGGQQLRRSKQRQRGRLAAQARPDPSRAASEGDALTQPATRRHQMPSHLSRDCPATGWPRASASRSSGSAGGGGGWGWGPAAGLCLTWARCSTPCASSSTSLAAVWIGCSFRSRLPPAQGESAKVRAVGRWLQMSRQPPLPPPRCRAWRSCGSSTRNEATWM
jgi:hypothetical protein